MRKGIRARAVGFVLVIAGTLLMPAASQAAEYTYVAMADGTKIAISVNYPENFDPDRPGGWPTLFAIDGYAGGAGTQSTLGNNYVGVYASVRGTGCSGGRFDLFDRRHAYDGHEIIENWIVKQPWSNGKVGIVGHSYPGLTGFLVASTNPPHLTAIAVSGLIDDVYRGIVYPGGVPNYGFPLYWSYGFRPAVELAANSGRMIDETTAPDPTCAANIATRPPKDALDDPFLQGITSQEDETWYAVRSLRSYLHGITKPIHITQQYQDEQTGPRGGHWLWEHITGVPKRLVLTNGVHGSTSVGSADRAAWLDCWIIKDGQNCGEVSDPSKRVRIHFETTDGAGQAPYVSSNWPLPETDWQRFHLRAAGTLTSEAPAAGEAPTNYVSLTAGRQTAATGGFGFGNEGAGRITYASGPDEASYLLDFGAPTAIAGPINLSLWATSTAVDTDFFVDVIDVWPDGRYEFVQRGMQRASHRAIDHLQTDVVQSGPHEGEIYRAYHPHTNATKLTPLEPTEFEIEVFPVSHFFREGHKLMLKIHAPPPVDPLSIWAYPSAQPPALNTILQDAGHPSSILLPLLPDTSWLPETGPDCGAQVGIPCFTPVAS
ncbi:MAG: CocE/NonD family hydrolase [Actinomycetota bacterium]